MSTVRATVSATVHDSLRAAILAGELAPGDAVDSERVLSERFAVNRQAVREAVKRLQQAGLVQVSHGGATRVLDWRTSGGLELLTDMPITAAFDSDTLRSILEMRASIGTDAARRCAQRSAHLGDVITADVQAVRDAAAADDQPALVDAYALLWAHIVDGAQNIAYTLSLNSLVGGLDAVADQAPLFAGEWHDFETQRALAGAIATGDDDGARRTARALLERSIP